MDAANRTQLPFWERTFGSTAYIYFLRDYWDGGGSDVLVWLARPDGGASHLCAITGETDDPTVEHDVLLDSPIEPNEFDTVLTELSDAGVFEGKVNPDAFAFSNSHDEVRIKSFDGRQCSWRLKSGASDDLRHSRTLEILAAHAPWYWDREEGGD